MTRHITPQTIVLNSKKRSYRTRAFVVDPLTSQILLRLKRPTSAYPLAWDETGRIRARLSMLVAGEEHFAEGEFVGGIISLRGQDMPETVLSFDPLVYRDGDEIKRCGQRGPVAVIRLELTWISGDVSTELLAFDSQEAPPPDYPITNSVAFNAVSAAYSISNPNPISVSHTAAGSNRAAFIGTAGVTGNVFIDYSATYGGTSATELFNTVQQADTLQPWGNYKSLAGYRFVAPSTSAQTVTATGSGGTVHYMGIQVISFTGVDQTTPCSTPVTDTAMSSTDPTLSCTVSGVTSNDMVVDTMIEADEYASGSAAGADQTQRSSYWNTSIEFWKCSTQPGSAGGVMSWAPPDTQFWSAIMGAVAFKATTNVTHTTSGALTQQAHTLAGTARRFRAHPTTGALTQQAHTLAGTARRFRAHPTNGNIICSAAAVAGTAKHNKLHPTSGALAQQAHTLAGTARHTPNHKNTGALSAQAAAVSGAVLHRYKHTTTGTLAAQASAVGGTARRFRVHATTGALAAPAGAIDGAARHQNRHPTTGVLTQQAHTLAGTAQRFRAHPTTGTPAAQGANVSGTARHNRPHATTGTPAAQGANVSGTARHNRPHPTTGTPAAQAATVAGTARRFRAHAANGALAAQPSGVFGNAWKPQRLRPASDVSDGTWLTESEGSNLWDSINEPLPVNPADFIYTLGTSLCEVLLDPGTAPAVATEHTVLYEARGNGVADMKVQLKQGAAVIAEWIETAVPVAATRYTHTLTEPQAASITDYTDLRLVFETLP